MIGIISAGIAPCIALLTYFYLKDRFDSEPFSLVFKAFIYGFLLVFPIMFIQYAFAEENIGQIPIIQTFILSGLLEEFFKWFIFLFIVYKNAHFDFPYDGIVYGVAISLGFASLENLLYLFAYGIEHAFSRAIFPVSSHAIFGVIMGYYFGKSKFALSNNKRWLFIALLYPTLLHGIYDFILLTIRSNWLNIMVPFMLFLWILALRKVKKANYHLPMDKVIYLEQEKSRNIF
jgi:protease PrsW